MSARAFLVLTLAAGTFAAGCKDSSSPIPHTPTHFIIVSGANQSGDVSAALTQPLVVQALDGAAKPVAGVPVTWSVTGGGSITPATGTTDNDGKSTATWTLSSTVSVQVATATSSQIVGVAVSFVANNGATITGSVSPAGGSPFNTSFSRSPGARSSRATMRVSNEPRASTNRIVVGFKNDMLGLAAATSTSYRSMSVSRQAMSRLQASVSALSKGRPLSHAEISPALLAARLRVDDTTQIGATMQALSADPTVAWVERDDIISIHDGAPRPMTAMRVMRQVDQSPVPSTAAVATKLPNDPNFFLQLWPAAMLDLPRAWGITTGSPTVIVASIDMGIRFDHPDIAANLTTDGYDFVSQALAGSGPQTICEGGTFTTIDGDGDGPDADPTDPDDFEFDPDSNCWFHNDLGDHGLWTAGIIGAVGNEGRGASGVNWTVKIRPIRVLGVTGQGTNFDVAQGILYGAGLPAPGAGGVLVQAPSAAQILNLSLGSPSGSTSLRNAVTAAFNAGSLVVASAGNDGLDIQEFPGAYPNAMAVAAVGQDGTLATYSNGGTYISVAAPGGDFRFDDNGGGGILGPGWDFSSGTATYLFGYGTSAAAPYVSGVAALILAQTPGLTPTALRARIEQFATRPAGVTRSDILGWGIVNAYNSLTQQLGPPRQTYVRLIDATSGNTVKSVAVSSAGTFSFAQIAAGAYYVQAGDDETGDATLGTPGRRFGWAGGFGTPTLFNVNNNAQSAAILLGLPTEVEPNDDNTHANMMTVNTYVTGNITTPDTRDMYSVNLAAGQYTFETSGLVGSCGEGIELDTVLSVVSAAGLTVGSNDNFTSSTSRFCSRVRVTVTTPGVYYVTVTGTGFSGQASHGRYRLEVRAGT